MNDHDPLEAAISTALDTADLDVIHRATGESKGAAALARWMRINGLAPADPTTGPHNGGSCAQAEEWLDDAVGELNSISEHLTRRGARVRRDDGQFDYCAAIDDLMVIHHQVPDRLARALHDADCGCGDYDDVEDPRYITAARAALAGADPSQPATTEESPS